MKGTMGRHVPVLAPGQRQALLAQGMALFNAGEWLASHEAFELLWRAEPAAHRDIYKALVQVAAAMHHAGRENHRGARRLLGRASELFAVQGTGCPEAGVDVGALAAQVHRLARQCVQQPCGDSLDALAGAVLPGLSGCDAKQA